jgi:hypothetical protein
MLNKVIVGISVAVILLTACAEASADGVSSTVLEDGGPKDGTLSVGIDAIQAALRGNYAGLSADLGESINGVNVEDFMVLDEESAIFGMRWGRGTSENPVWGVVRLNGKGQAADGSFPVELVAVGRDTDAMYAEGDSQVVVFHEAGATGDKQIEATNRVVRLRKIGATWGLEVPTGTVTLTTDQVSQLPWGSWWVEQVQEANGSGVAHEQASTEQAPPTEAAITQPPDGWFKWDGPTLMKWNASKGSYEAYTVNGEAPINRMATIDNNGSRLTLLKADKYGISYADLVVDAETGAHYPVDSGVYTNGTDMFVYNLFEGVWIQLPLDRSWDEYLQMTRENKQKWMNGEMEIEEDQLFKDKNEAVNMRLYPDQWPQLSKGNGTFQGMPLGVSKSDGLISIVLGFIDGEGKPQTTEIVPWQGNEGLERFSLDIRHTHEVYSTTSEGNRYVYVKPADIPRVVEALYGKPLLVYFHIYNQNNPDEIGVDVAYCDVPQADKAKTMGAAMASNDSSDEIFHREPGDEEGLTTPCGRLVIPADQLVR